jgi:hypothetical protein
MEWQYDWELQGRLPLQIELTMAVGAKGEEIRQIFWVPPKQNPEVLMRQMQQGAANGALGGGSGPDMVVPGAPGGGGGPPDGGGGPPTIQIPKP